MPIQTMKMTLCSSRVHSKPPRWHCWIKTRSSNVLLNTIRGSWFQMLLHFSLSLSIFVAHPIMKCTDAEITDRKRQKTDVSAIAICLQKYVCVFDTIGHNYILHFFISKLAAEIFIHTIKLILLPKKLYFS